MRRPSAAEVQYGGRKSEGSFTLSPRSTATLACAGVTPSSSSIRSMQACSNTTERSERASGSGAPEVPPVLAFAVSKCAPPRKAAGCARTADLSSSGQDASSRVPRTLLP
jgi:hypothetical protein